MELSERTCFVILAIFMIISAICTVELYRNYQKFGSIETWDKVYNDASLRNQACANWCADLVFEDEEESYSCMIRTRDTGSCRK